VINHNDPILPEVKVSGSSPFATIGGYFIHERFEAGLSIENIIATQISLAGIDAKIKMYYFLPSVKPGESVVVGEKIGTAQNIANKYGGDMIPHVHLEIVSIDPELFE